MGRASKHPSDQQAGPERKCITTNQVLPKAEMIRFVVGPDDKVFPDLAEKLPGRGVWVSAKKDALEQAVSKGLFARGFKKPVKADDGLVEQVEKLLLRRVLNTISLSRKGGDAVSGYEKVKTALQKEEARVLIQASDGSSRGKSKLSTPHRGHFIGWLTADELGQAFGREVVIHAALGAGGLAQRVVEEAARLRALRVPDKNPDMKKESKRT